MAIKTHDKIGPMPYAHKEDYNAMIIEIIRTGQILFFDGEKIILLKSEEPSITRLDRILFVGRVVYDFIEKSELNQILRGDGDRYMLEHITETVRVVARFCI